MTEENKPKTVDDNSDALPEQTPAEGDVGEEDSGGAEDSVEAKQTANQASENSEVDAADPAAHDDIDLNASAKVTDEEDYETELEDSEEGDPYGGHSAEELKRILEAAIFASGTTLSVSHLRGLFEDYERPHRRVIKDLMVEVMAHYEGRGMQLVEVGSGYRFQTDAATAQWVARLWEEKPQRYSRALMETIALIAYRQPITRGEIEDVRGVAVSSNIIRTLLEREWVRVVGHRDVPGRPAMYATTRQFLDYFSLSSLDQLPSLSDIRDFSELNPQMNLDDMGEEEKPDTENQSVISFSEVIDDMRDRADGKTGSEFIDEHLDDELKAMDEVNRNFEQSIAQQKAELEHPNLELDDEDDESTVQTTDEPEALNSDSETTENEPKNQPEEPISEEEKWKIIQEKLAQQQALLDDRESDPQPEENDNE